MLGTIPLIGWVLLAAGEAGGAPSWAPLMLLGAMGVLFYFMMIRPQSRKQAQITTMLANLKKNDRIVTIGGIYGKVVNVQKDSDEVVINVDENTNTKLRISRGSIGRVLTDETAGGKKDNEK